MADLRTVVRDGASLWELRCPGCGEWAEIDDDQLNGRVSIDHSAGGDDRGRASSRGCGFHEKRNWLAEAVQP